MNFTILAIDPGKDKTGIAILYSNGDIVEHSIGKTVSIFDLIRQLISKYNVKYVIMGNGTTSRKMAENLEKYLDRKIQLIDEYRTTDEARKLYFDLNPPRGIKKIMPRGLLSPSVPIDDYAAIVIGRRFLNYLKK